MANQILSGSKTKIGFILLFLFPVFVFAKSPPLAITEESTQVKIPGRFIWADLITDDINKASDFYRKLFGWQVSKTKSKYYMVTHNGRRIAGLYESDIHNSANNQWLPFFSSNDPTAFANYAAQNNGEIVVAPRKVEGRGYYTVVEDNQGANIGVLNSNTGDPEEYYPEEGDWLWQELWASDPVAAADFYRQAGYKVISNSYSDKSDKDLILVAAGYARAGIVKKLEPEHRSGWLLYIRVNDVEAISAQAVKLGGKILYRPPEAASAFPVSILADPTGGVFAISEWEAPSEPESASASEVAK